MAKSRIVVPKELKVAKNKPEFPEDWTNIKGLDPLAPKHIEFDWEVLRRQMNEAKDDMSPTDWTLLADVMNQLLSWVVKGNNLKVIGIRALALAWTINPNIVGGAAITKLARTLGIERSGVSYHAANARRKFRTKNRAHGHGWNFKENEGA